MNIAEGDAFPAVSGTTHDGQSIDLASFHGSQNVVLYFYPRDLTPGCTREAIDFDRKLEAFKEAGTAVIGMSVDPSAAHEKFTQSCGLRFPLLTDTDKKTSERLGILSPSGMSQRATFVIDKSGVLRHAYEVSKVDGHADEVLAAVRALG